MWSEIATNGGVLGGVATFGFIGHVVLDWRRERREAITAKQEGRTDANTAIVQDAATANSMMLESLRELREENKGLRTKINRLQEGEKVKDKEIAEMQTKLKETREQLHIAQTQLDKITTQLNDYLKQR